MYPSINKQFQIKSAYLSVIGFHFIVILLKSAKCYPAEEQIVLQGISVRLTHLRGRAVSTACTAFRSHLKFCKLTDNHGDQAEFSENAEPGFEILFSSMYR